jgi:hypothetical protein
MTYDTYLAEGCVPCDAGVLGAPLLSSLGRSCNDLLWGLEVRLPHTQTQYL